MWGEIIVKSTILWYLQLWWCEWRYIDVDIIVGKGIDIIGRIWPRGYGWWGLIWLWLLKWKSRCDGPVWVRRVIRYLRIFDAYRVAVYFTNVRIPDWCTFSFDQQDDVTYCCGRVKSVWYFDANCFFLKRFFTFSIFVN
jgi:hypothetical protein